LFLLIADGFKEFVTHLWPILALLLSTAGFGLWIAHSFTRNRNLSSLLSITLAIPLGTIALTILFLVSIIFSRLWPAALSIGAWIIAFGGFSLLVAWISFHARDLIRETGTPPLAVGTVAFILLLLLRLAFLRGLVAPPYADSAWHYLLTTRLLDSVVTLNTVTSGSYYHLGFHVLTSWLAALTRLGLLTLLPLTAQVMLVVLPLSVYALALTLTGQPNAARLSAFAAALLWNMPAFSANWGKYPAIAGTVLLPAVCAAVLLLSKLKGKWGLPIITTAFLLLAVTWFHSRILILLACAGAAVLVTTFLLKRTPQLLLRMFGGLILTGCAILYITAPSLYAIYNGRYLLPIIGVLILLPFALFHQPRLTSGVAVFTLFMLGCSFISIPAWLRLPAQSLLDRQFLEMSLFIPLSLLVGIGASALLRLAKKTWLKTSVWLILVLWIIFSAFNTNTYTPDPCCNFVTPSDLAAINWMKDDLPSDAVMYIAAIKKEDGLIGSDAGVWVTPLTGTFSQFLPYDYAWFSGHEHAKVCALTPAYLYAGDQPYSFQINAITRPDWYELVFENSSTSIYRIISCKP
jgi:hypothetical protein